MKEVMTTKEVDAIFYSGLFMIYMQAIRFLTDYLLGDSYYGAKYDGHNLVWANNQVVLLQRLLEKQSVFERQTDSVMHA
jgi:hypothetical protein